MTPNLRMEEKGSERKTLLGLFCGSGGSLPTLSVLSVLFQALHNKH